MNSQVALHEVVTLLESYNLTPQQIEDVMVKVRDYIAVLAVESFLEVIEMDKNKREAN